MQKVAARSQRAPDHLNLLETVERLDLLEILEKLEKLETPGQQGTRSLLVVVSKSLLP